MPASHHSVFTGLTDFFAQPLSKYSLVWHHALHTPYISSLNCCLLFAVHACTTATCFAVLQPTQPFYGFLDYVRDNPGEPVPEGTFRHLLDFLVQNESNTGRCTNNPDGLPPHPDYLLPSPLPSPPFLRWMPFLTQPSQFNLAWDRHQICWLAYPVAWFCCSAEIMSSSPRTVSSHCLRWCDCR